MITVIDMKISNVGSVAKAFGKLGCVCEVTSDPNVIGRSDGIVLAGVGSFREAAERIQSSGIHSVIRNKVLKEGTPILGICLGMQLLASVGMEGGESEGLGLINGRVEYLRCASNNMRIPHVGWNSVNGGQLSLFESIPENSYFYFVHSYELLLGEDVPVATCCYGVDFVAAVQKGNIMGAQFHPEKSQNVGLALLENFLEGVAKQCYAIG